MLPKTVLLPEHGMIRANDLFSSNEKLKDILMRHLLVGHYVDYLKKHVNPGTRVYRAVDIFHNAFDDDLELRPSIVVLGKDFVDKAKSDKGLREAISNVFTHAFTFDKHDKQKGKPGIITGVLPVVHNDEGDIVANIKRMYESKNKDVPLVSYVLSNDGKRGLIFAHRGVRAYEHKHDDDYEGFIRQERKKAYNSVVDYLKGIAGPGSDKPIVIGTSSHDL